MTAINVDEAHRFSFEHEGIEHFVYKDGAGPGVLVMHELPGMTPKCIELAERIMNAGYTVYLPLFFGEPGEDSDFRGGIHVTALCVRHEFECLATDKTGRVSHWIRALCGRIRSECGGKGVGAIGMCFTGSVVLSVMLDDTVVVPVLSQPALPFHEVLIPGGPSAAERKRSIGLDPEDLALVKQRAAQMPILGFRFTTDKICPRERFQRLRDEFGENFQGTEIPTGPGNPGNFPNDAHSVLTKYFVDDPTNPTRQALDLILARFAERLR